ncbi:MAG: hypothetical protein ABIH28_03190 [archaeon]
MGEGFLLMERAPFVSLTDLSVSQRKLIKGEPDYFIFVEGKYVESFTHNLENKIVGDYATSFAGACRRVKRILKDFPTTPFRIGRLDFPRTDWGKKDKIKSLIENHNLSRYLEIE